MNCGTCRCFHGDGGATGQCRFNPPVVIGHQDDAPETCWPRVTVSDWCGKYAEHREPQTVQLHRAAA